MPRISSGLFKVNNIPILILFSYQLTLNLQPDKSVPGNNFRVRHVLSKPTLFFYSSQIRDQTSQFLNISSPRGVNTLSG